MSNPVTEKNFFQTFEDLEEYLESLGMFHIDYSLNRIKIIIKKLFPNALPFTIAHIVGTNGKGSTATFLSSLATAHGIKNGLYTSPHFVSIRERIKINGKMLEENEWLTCANIAAAAQEQNERLTYFEFVTALSLIAFARAEVELAVLEAGMGGQYDATNAVYADLLLFTPIGMDHEQIIGPALQDIAANKAGAIKPNQLIITCEQNPDVLTILKSTAQQNKTKLLKPVIPTHFHALGMTGIHQKTNACLALAGFSQLAARKGWAIKPPAVRRGLAHAFIPGRLQFIKGFLQRPSFLLDGAHNTQAFTALAEYLKQQNIFPRAIIFSCLSDKHLEPIFPSLKQWTNGPVLIPPIPNNPRAADPKQLAEKIGKQSIVVSSMKEALQYAENKLSQTSISDEKNPVLICGSLYLLTEFYKIHPACLSIP